MRETNIKSPFVSLARLLGTCALILLCCVAKADPVRFNRIVPAQPTFTSPQKLSVMVFFNFTGTAQKLLTVLRNWTEDAGGDVVFEEVPLVTSTDTRLVKAFFVAETLGVLGPVSSSLLDLGKMRETVSQARITTIFQSWGIGKIGFDAAWRSTRTKRLQLRAESLAARYEVQHRTNPVIIVDGDWRLRVPRNAEPSQVISALDKKVAQLRSLGSEYD